MHSVWGTATDFFQVVGASLEPFYYQDGDLLAVDASARPEDGDLIVAEGEGIAVAGPVSGGMVTLPGGETVSLAALPVVGVVVGMMRREKEAPPAA